MPSRARRFKLCLLRNRSMNQCPILGICSSELEWRLLRCCRRKAACRLPPQLRTVDDVLTFGRGSRCTYTCRK